MTRKATSSFLSMTLNGRVVWHPHVAAEIMGGRFLVEGPEKPVLERLRAAVSMNC